MKNLILILLLMPASSFSQSKSETKKICELGIGGRFYLKFSSKIKSRVGGHIDGYFGYKENEIENFDVGVEFNLKEHQKEALFEKLRKRKKKMRQAFLSRDYDANFHCISTTNDKDFKEDEQADRYSEISDMHYMLEHKDLVFKKCLSSKDPLSFVAKDLEIPKKHIRDYKMLLVEMTERFTDELENKNICNIQSAAGLFSTFSIAENQEVIEDQNAKENQETCKNAIIFETTIQKKLKSCKPRT